MAKKILIIAEHHGNELRKTAFEMAAAAAGLNAENVSVLIAGHNVKDLAGALEGYPVNTVLTADDPALEKYNLKALSGLAEALIVSEGFDTVMMAAGTHGRELLPYLAAKKGFALAADITAVSADGDDLKVTHPVYAGKSLLNLKISGPVCLTVRPNAFTPEKSGGSPEMKTVAVPAVDGGTPVKELKLKESARPELTEASVIVSGGRGMGGPEHYPVIEELADLLGAAVGASRAAVDAGWRPHSDQVGQTGKTVSPNLYIACGISGAIQHLAGMSSSKFIVAVNKDPEAPIFKVADYGIVGDLFQVVPAMVAELKK